MAGDWIKMRVNLVAHPKVLKTAEALLADPRYLEWSALSYALPGFPVPTPEQDDADRHAALRVTRYVVVASLLRFWGYANEHAKGEFIECVTRQDVDDIAGVPGFADALGAVRWATFDAKKGGVKLPDFNDHNTSVDERKSAGAERQKRYRDRLKQRPSSGDKTSDVTRDVTSRERLDKRREESNTPKPPTGVVSKFPPLFEDFWSAYPRKTAKDSAAKAFAKRRVDAVLLATMLAAIKAQGLRERCAKGESQFVPHPATWLNDGRWQDEVEAATADDIFAGAH